jgi:hypothetical protein
MRIKVYELNEIGEYGDSYTLFRFDVKQTRDELREFRAWIRHWAENLPTGHELPEKTRCRHRGENLEMIDVSNRHVIFRAIPVN